MRHWITFVCMVSLSVAKTKALSARHATRHNIWYRAIRIPEWAQWR